MVPEGKSEEAITRLARVGYDYTIGYLEGGMQAWIAAGKTSEQLTSISSIEFQQRTKKEVLSVLDVRKQGEYNTMHLKLHGLIHLSLDQINHRLDQIDTQKTYYIHCAGGYRSVIAASILKANRFHNVIDIAGGFAAIKKTELSLSESICPSTL